MCSKHRILMQTLGLLLILAAAFSSAATDGVHSTPGLDSVCTEYRDTLSKIILKFLEDLRSHMDVGIPSLGIPPLDPLQIPDQAVRIKKPHQYDLTGRISTSKLEGLREFNVTHISTSLLHLQANVTVTLPYVFLTGRYNLKGQALGFIPIRGNGPYIVKPTSIKTSVYTTMSLTHGHIQVKSMDFTLDMSALYARFEGLFGGGHFGNIANSLMNRFGMTLFRRIEPKIHDKVRVALITEINEILKDMPILDLIGLISKTDCQSALHEMVKTHQMT